MKRVIVVVVFASLLGGPAAAQGPQDVDSAADALGRVPTREVSLLATVSLPAAVLDRAAQAQTPPAAAQRPPLARRRRGSMVGYIDDATIESKVRIRFDAGLHATAPDRAEFFYAKCGCYSGLPPEHPGYDPHAPGPHPGAADDLNFQHFVVEGEYAFGSRISVFGLMPFRRIQPQSFIPDTGGVFPDHGGTGDLRGGLKLGLTGVSDTSVTAKFQIFLPTGDASKGLGTDHASFEPAVLLHQRLSDVVDLESQLGVWLPSGGSAPVPTAADGQFAGRVFFYGIGPSFTVYDTDRVQFAPVVELVGWHVLSGNQTGAVTDASGTNIVNLKVGGRLSYDAGSIYVGYGHALTDASWYDDIVRVEYRYSF